MTNNMCHGTFIEHALCNSLNALQNTVKKGKDFYACCPQMGSSDPVSGQSHQIIPCCHCFPQIVSPAHEAVDVTSWDQDWNKNEKEKNLFSLLYLRLSLSCCWKTLIESLFESVHINIDELMNYTDEQSNAAMNRARAVSACCLGKKKREVCLYHTKRLLSAFGNLSYCLDLCHTVPFLHASVSVRSALVCWAFSDGMNTCSIAC